MAVAVASWAVMAALGGGVVCAPFYSGMSPTAREQFFLLVDYFHTLSAANGFDYSIVYGSAIGYYRYNKTLPWDDDVDVMIKKKDTDKVQSLIRYPYCYTEPTNRHHPQWKVFRCGSKKAGSQAWGYPYLDIFPQPPNERSVFPSIKGRMHGHTMKFPKDIVTHLIRKYGKNVRTECKSMVWLHRTESRPASVEKMPCAMLMKACFPGYRVWYINLDRRQDRKRLLLDEFAKQGISNFMRIRAVEKKPGLPIVRAASLACAQSHLRALGEVVSPVGVVAEDDVMFVSAMPKAELERPSFEWDVLLLAYNGRVNASDCRSAYGQRWCRSGGQLMTTSLYAVRQGYKHRLERTFGEAVRQMRSLGSSVTRTGGFAIDRSWWALQQEDGHNWYAAVPRIAKQRGGFSDIEGRRVDYGV